MIPGKESDNPAGANRESGRKAGQGGPQLFSMDLLLDAVVIGVLLGCFYAAVSLGLSVSFGLLDVPHVAHPAFLVLASYAVFFLNERSEEHTYELQSPVHLVCRLLLEK